MFTKTTNSINITVKPYYLDEQSEPDDQHYVWAYQVTINNLSKENKRKIYFIHMNHTNPMLDPDSDLSKLLINKGFNIARLGQKLYL